MKKNYRDNTSNEILYKTEELLDAASNRYKMTIQIANRAKRRRYQDKFSLILFPFLYVAFKQHFVNNHDKHSWVFDTQY